MAHSGYRGRRQIRIADRCLRLPRADTFLRWIECFDCSTRDIESVMIHDDCRGGGLRRVVASLLCGILPHTLYFSVPSYNSSSAAYSQHPLHSGMCLYTPTCSIPLHPIQTHCHNTLRHVTWLSRSPVTFTFETQHNDERPHTRSVQPSPGHPLLRGGIRNGWNCPIENLNQVRFLMDVCYVLCRAQFLGWRTGKIESMNPEKMFDRWSPTAPLSETAAPSCCHSLRCWVHFSYTRSRAYPRYWRTLNDFHSVHTHFTSWGHGTTRAHMK